MPPPVDPRSTRDPLALDQQVCFSLAVASRTVISLYRPLLEPLGLTHPQYLVMLALWQSEPLSVTDLSRMLDLDAGTLSRLLKRLERDGRVRRERDPSDERSLAVVLTQTGRELRREALAVPDAVIEQLGMGLDALDELRGQLAGIIAAAKARGASQPDGSPAA